MISKTTKNLIRLLRNKLAKAELDREYYKDAYLSMYVKMCKIDSVVNSSTFNSAGLTMPDIAKQITSCLVEDEKLFDKWQTSRRDLYAEQHPRKIKP